LTECTKGVTDRTESLTKVTSEITEIESGSLVKKKYEEIKTMEEEYTKITHEA
jgi:hypothetical protein